MRGAPHRANPGEGGILPVYLPTTFRSHFAAKFSMQIVNVPMQIVCISDVHFRCIHLFRTVGDSNPALIINDFRGKNRACLRMFTSPIFHPCLFEEPARIPDRLRQGYIIEQVGGGFGSLYLYHCRYLPRHPCLLVCKSCRYLMDC